MTCQDFDDQIDAYARGALRDDLATAIEQHAAVCAACALRLERLPQVDLSAFAPALPLELRDVTLAVVRQRRARSTRYKWFAGGLMAAAAVIAALMIPRGTSTGPVVVASGDSLVRSPVLATALAADHATTEFEAIDAAERELRTAIAAAPADAQLHAFLASVTAQREELRRRVEAAHT